MKGLVVAVPGAVCHKEVDDVRLSSRQASERLPEGSAAALDGDEVRASARVQTAPRAVAVADDHDAACRVFPSCWVHVDVPRGCRDGVCGEVAVGENRVGDNAYCTLRRGVRCCDSVGSIGWWAEGDGGGASHNGARTPTSRLAACERSRGSLEDDISGAALERDAVARHGDCGRTSHGCRLSTRRGHTSQYHEPVGMWQAGTARGQTLIRVRTPMIVAPTLKSRSQRASSSMYEPCPATVVADARILRKRIIVPAAPSVLCSRGPTNGTCVHQCYTSTHGHSSCSATRCGTWSRAWALGPTPPRLTTLSKENAQSGEKSREWPAR